MSRIETDAGAGVVSSPNADTIAWLAAQPRLLVGYAGQWIAFASRRIVVSNHSIAEVVRLAKAAGVADPLLVPVPPAEAVIG